jgi:hypothetical protein
MKKSAPRLPDGVLSGGARIGELNPVRCANAATAEQGSEHSVQFPELVDLAVRTRASALGEDRAQPKPAGPGHHEYTNELEWLPEHADGTYLQRIEVEFTPGARSYSYAWGGTETLDIGDVVQAPRPPSWTGPYFGHARVSSLRSGYEGPVRTITTLLRKHREGQHP